MGTRNIERKMGKGVQRESEREREKWDEGVERVKEKNGKKEKKRMRERDTPVRRGRIEKKSESERLEEGVKR